MSEYYSIKAPSEGFHKEKGSKFYSFAFPSSVEDQAKSILSDLKKKYPDASHHCYAWIIGLANQTWRAYDDGEPTHSAGSPILGQIKSLNLTNTLVVVIRYFGGTKLGVGGLIGAYQRAAEDALQKATIERIFEKCKISFEFSYPEMSLMEKVISDLEIEVETRNFLTDCKIVGWIKKDDLRKFSERASEWYNVKIEVHE